MGLHYFWKRQIRDVNGLCVDIRWSSGWRCVTAQSWTDFTATLNRHSRSPPMSHFFLQRQTLILAALCAFGTAGCADLPGAQAILDRHEAQAVRFENARGPVSVQR